MPNTKSNIPPLLQRLVYGWVLIFIGSVTMVGLWLFYTDDPILIPKWRAIIGLLILFGVTAVIFATKDHTVFSILVEGFASGSFLIFVVLLFMLWPHPMRRYAAVYHVDSEDEDNLLDGIYFRSSALVKTIEKEGPQNPNTAERLVLIGICTVHELAF